MFKYSFIVPVYNVEEYICKCVESILAQDYNCEDYEIILVDDGSTDGSGVICDDYSEKYERIGVVHQDNQGLLMARGAGVRRSSGKYLLFVDSDDYIEKSLLSSVDAYIEQYAPDFLCFGYVMNSGKKELLLPITSSQVEKLSKEEFLSRFASSDEYNSIWSKVIKADILRSRVNEIYDMSLNIGEDKLQTAYILKDSKKILLINKCLYHYTVRTNSIVHCKKIKDIYDIIDVNIRVESIIKSIIDMCGFSEQLRNSILRDYRINSLNVTLDHIYKYNKRRDCSCNRKISAIAKVVLKNKDYFVSDDSVVEKLRLYNRVRLLLIVNEYYKCLLCLDTVLFVVQKCKMKLMNK